MSTSVFRWFWATPVRKGLFAFLCGAILLGSGWGAMRYRPWEPRTGEKEPLWERALEGEGPENERADGAEQAAAFYLLKRLPGNLTGLPMERYTRALQRISRMGRYSAALSRFLPQQTATTEALGTWQALGPGNIGGRTRAILIHPTTPSTMYAAGVAGGVWKSTNSGASWTPMTDLIANLAVSSMVMDPANPETIYAGTGEGYFNVDSVRGNGIFKTTDGGASWTQLASTVNNSNFYYVNKIVISPSNSQRMYAATKTGVFRSLDGGGSWSQVVNGSSVNGCTDLVIRKDATGLTSDVVFAACGTFTTATVYRNTDAGGSGSWNAVLSETSMGRTSLAIAPSNQDIVYALASNSSDYSMYAVFRSTTGGASGSWTAQVRNTNSNALNKALLTNVYYGLCLNSSYSQGWYDNVIAVDPVDPNRVWVGGVDIFRSDDGGANWGYVPCSIHPDHHAIVFHPQYDGSSNQIMFVGNDGGIYKTTNARASVRTGSALCLGSCSGYVSFNSLNNGYGVTQFYHGTPYPDGSQYFGGTQDNGTNRGSDTAGANSWQSILGGDGGYVAIDPTNTNTLYAENTGLSIQKSTNGGSTWSGATSGISNSGFLFISPFFMDSTNASRLWTGGSALWRTTNGASSWTQASAAVAGGNVSAIATAPSNANFGLAGTSSGYIHSTTIAQSSTSATAWPNVRPRTGYVSWVTFDPTDASIAYATYSTFNSSGTDRHVYRSTDGGLTWTGLDGSGVGALPDVPTHCLVVDPTNTSRLFVGTDLGVFSSVDGGATWAVENTGFANVVVESLAINTAGSTKYLFAFTHGRGAFRVNLGTQACNSPMVSSSPANRTACAGSSTTFSATATGTGPFTYQWRKGGTNISGATNSSYSIASVAAADAGSYDVVVTNGCGTATSSAATLTVNAATSIATPPSSQTVCPTGTATFTVTAGGTGPFTYQWRKGGVNISGATNSSYSIASVTSGSAGNYDVVVTGACGTATSGIATLTVPPATSVAAPPSNQTVCAGAPATFSVTAGGTGPFTYQWRKGGVNISGATNSSYTIAATATGDAGSYDVVITGACGTATSVAATLTVNAATSVITPPSTQTVCAGAPATFTVTAGGTGPFTYQWRKGGVNISGATNSSYTIASTTAGSAGSYDVVVTGACGTATSAAATLTVNPATSVLTPPVNQTVCAGAPATFSVTAAGTGPFTYQWRKGGVNISGATNSSYTIVSTAAADAGSYDVMIAGACGTAASAAATLTVNPATSIATPPSNQTVCPGAPATFSVTAAGTGPFTYQWRKGGVNISGATNSSYTIAATAAGDAGSYDVVVTGACGTATSAAATLTLSATTSVATPPSNQTVCAGASATFSATAAGTGPFTYQWRKGGVNISGATNSSYTIASTTSGSAGSYDVVVTGACGTATSAAATLTVNTTTSVLVPPSNQTVCAGAPATFSATAAGTGPFTYQWRKGGVNISGATNSSYTIAATAAADAGSYDVVISGACGTATSAAATLTVNTTTSVATPPASQTVCAGAPATFMATAAGTGPFTYQWRKGGVNIPGATNSSYTIAATATGDAGSYDVVIAGSCGMATSVAATLTVATLTVTPGPTSYGAGGGSGSVSVTSAGSCGWTATSNAAWISIVGAASGSGTGTVNYSVAANPGLARTGTLTVAGQTVTFNQASGCAVTVNPSGGTLTAATSGQAYSQSFTASGAASPSFTISAGALPNGLTLTTAGLLSGTPSATGTFNFTVLAADSNGCTGARDYSLTVNPPPPSTSLVNGGFEGTSAPWVLSSLSLWTTGDQPNSGTGNLLLGGFNPNGSAYQEFALPAGSSPQLSFWLSIASNETSFFTRNDILYVEMLDATGNLLGQLASFSNLDKSGYVQRGPYSLGAYAGRTVRLQFRSTGNFSLPTSFRVDDVTMTGTASAPSIATQPASQTACAGTTASFTASASGTPSPSVQWQLSTNGGANFSDLPGETNPTLSLANVTAGQSGYQYRAVFANASGTATTNAATLTISTATSVGTPPSSQTVCAGSPVTFTATGAGTGPFTYQWRKGGVNIPGATNSSYTIAATATGDAGSYDVVIAGSCGAATSSSATLTVTSLTVTPGPTSYGVGGGSGSVSITSGGSCGWTATSNAAWIVIQGAASGSGAGTVNYSVAANAGPARTGTLTVAGQAVAITQSSACAVTVNPSNGTLPAATAGQAYSQSFTASGAASPSFTISAGSLPNGLTLTTAGLLSGTTSATGTFNFTVLATDAGGCTGLRAYSLTVNPAASSELVVNGGFEGTSAPWVLSTAGLVVTNDQPRAGTGNLLLGGFTPAGTAYQTIVIPSGASPKLSFWLAVTSNETSFFTQYDTLSVEVLDASGNLLGTLATFSNLDKGSGYALRSGYSLSAFAGQTVRLQFRSAGNFTAPTSFRVDDVSVK